MSRLRAVLLTQLWLSACSPAPDAWLENAHSLELAASEGSRFPHLSVGPGGTTIMSWLEPGGEQDFILRFARWDSDRWLSAGEVASGRDWFINWADFPSVVPLGNNRLAAHWLQKTLGNVYSYEIRMSVSDDSGRTWTEPVTPHDDRTATEHGFVSLYGREDLIQAVWLDGRNTAGGHGHESGSDGAMTLRQGTLDAAGEPAGKDKEIDGRVCDCCQTDVAISAEGPVVVYRDRSRDELRDIVIVRETRGGWSAPQLVHADRWEINACPVNGPAVAAQGLEVAVAWFTAPDQPRVRLAFSDDGGRSFESPIEVAGGGVTGRVDVVFLDDGRAVVSWLAEEPGGTAILARPFSRNGPTGDPVVVADSNVDRASGFPQMVKAGDGLLFAWTDPGKAPRVRSAFAKLR